MGAVWKSLHSYFVPPFRKLLEGPCGSICCLRQPLGSLEGVPCEKECSIHSQETATRSSRSYKARSLSLPQGAPGLSLPSALPWSLPQLLCQSLSHQPSLPRARIQAGSVCELGERSGLVTATLIIFHNSRSPNPPAGPGSPLVTMLPSSVGPPLHSPHGSHTLLHLVPGLLHIPLLVSRTKKL